MQVLLLFTHLLCVFMLLCVQCTCQDTFWGVRGQLVGLEMKFRFSGLVANAFTTKPLTKMLLLGKTMEFLKPKS